MQELVFDGGGLADLFEMSCPNCVTTLDLWRVRLGDEWPGVEKLLTTGEDNAGLVATFSAKGPRLTSWLNGQGRCGIDVDLADLGWTPGQKNTLPELERFRFATQGGEIVESTVETDIALSQQCPEGLSVTDVPVGLYYFRFGNGQHGLQVAPRAQRGLKAFFTGAYMRRHCNGQAGFWVTPTAQFSSFDHQYDVPIGTWFAPAAGADSSLDDALMALSRHLGELGEHDMLLEIAVSAVVVHCAKIWRHLGSRDTDAKTVGLAVPNSLDRMGLGPLARGYKARYTSTDQS